MELDTDILRATYLDSVLPATIANPVPTVLGREEKVQGFKWDRTASFTPPCGRPLTPTYEVQCSNPRLKTCPNPTIIDYTGSEFSVPIKNSSCESMCPNPTIIDYTGSEFSVPIKNSSCESMCPNPTIIDYTGSEFSVPINRTKNPSCESNDYQITYNAYEDPDSPEELIIDLDHDDNYLDDDDSDFEIEPQASSDDNHNSPRHVGEIAMGDYKTTSQSVVTDLEDVSDDDLRDLTITKVTMKLRVIVSPDQGDALNCPSKWNSGNESEHSTSGFNTSMTDHTNVPDTHGQQHQKDTSAIPLTLSQLLEMRNKSIRMKNVPSTNANTHVYPYTSPTGTESPGRPVTRFRFCNDKLNRTKSSNKEKCNSRRFTQCPPSVKGKSCHSLVKKNVKVSKQRASNPRRRARVGSLKRYNCHCCDRTNLSSDEIAWHNTRKYQCCKCDKRFCLREILYKHCKKCVYGFT